LLIVYFDIGTLRVHWDKWLWFYDPLSRSDHVRRKATAHVPKIKQQTVFIGQFVNTLAQRTYSQQALSNKLCPTSSVQQWFYLKWL